MLVRPTRLPPAELDIPAPSDPPPPARASRAGRVAAWLGPDFTLFVACASALAVVGRLFGAHYVLRLSTMLLPGLVAPGLIAVHLARHGRAGLAATARAAARDWAPLVLVAVVFDNLENYTGLVRHVTIDATLYRVDLALFGVEPSVWIRRFYSPLVTDWMASCYGIFLVTPMSLAIVLWLRGRRADFREMALAVMLQMWLAFFIFICLPAGPPRYFAPLRPLLVRASFPSLHCAYGMLTLIYAWRFGDAVFAGRRRLFFWIVLPLEMSLFVATVYLRHHWIPDCLAGMGLAVGVCQLAPWLRRRWPRG